MSFIWQSFSHIIITANVRTYIYTHTTPNNFFNSTVTANIFLTPHLRYNSENGNDTQKLSTKNINFLRKKNISLES